MVEPNFYTHLSGCKAGELFPQHHVILHLVLKSHINILILLLKGINSCYNGLVNIFSLLPACFTIHRIKDELLQIFSSFVFTELIGQDLKMDSHSPFKDLCFLWLLVICLLSLIFCIWIGRCPFWFISFYSPIT